MAPKRPAPAGEQPPPAESSDEEQTSSGSIRSEEEEDEESSGSDEPKGTQQKGSQSKSSSIPPPGANSKPRGSAPSSESESESESEPDDSKGKTLKSSRPTADANPKSQKSSTSSESESESGSDSDVTPLAAKPMEGQSTPQSKKQNLKRPQSELTVATEDASKTPSKKPSNATSRSSQNTGEESSKKPLFQRVWSEEDEITLLEGMVEYWDKRGVDPSANINSFHAFIKERLHLDAVPGQLVTKIRNSKKKFKNNEAKVKNGKDKIFTKPNEQRAFELSRKLWGSEEGIIRETPIPKSNSNGSASKKKKSAENTSSAVLIPLSPQGIVKIKDEKVTEKVETQRSVSLCEGELSHFSSGRFDDRFLRRGLELINDSKRDELEERWKKLKLAELQVLSERALMIHEQTSLIIDAYKKSGEL